MSRWRRLAAIACAGLACPAVAQPSLELPPPPGAPRSLEQPASDEHRPLASRRIVRIFDFEEKLTADRPVPMGWFRAQHTEQRPRPGYPIWNRAELDFTYAHAGEGSVRLPLEGGSVALRLAPGAVPVLPGGVYRVTALASTKNLANARPALRLGLLDDIGNPIAGTEQQIVGSLSPSGGWIELAGQIEADHPEAAFLEIELAGLQPPEYRDFNPIARPIWDEDHRAVLWFDDVTIAQVARVELTTSEQSGMIVAPAVPELAIRIRDLTGERLTATARVHDLDGRLVDEQRFDIPPGGIERAWSPELPALGWYRAELEVFASDFAIGRVEHALCWVPSLPGRSERTRERALLAVSPSASGTAFSLAFDRLDEAAFPLVLPVVRALAVGGVTLSVIPEQVEQGDPNGAQQRRIERIAELIAQLREDWRELTLTIDRLPKAVMRDRGLDAGDVARGLVADEAAWAWAVEPVLAALGQQATRWQLGPVPPHQIGWDEPLGEVGPEARRRIGQLVPGPRIGVGWSGERAITRPELEASRVDRLVASMPAELGLAAPADFIALHADDLRELRRTLTLVLEPMPQSLLAPRDIVDDLARRAGLAWEAASDLPTGAVNLQIDSPWSWTGRRGSTLTPGPAAAAWRTLSDQLGTHRVVGRFPAPAGVTALVLAPVVGSGAAGSIMAWSDNDGRVDRLEATLGLVPVRVTDMFGNSAIVEPTANDRGGVTHDIAIGSSPVFIDNVDLPLAQLQSSLRLEPPVLQSTTRTLEHELVLRNPWPVPISGRWFLAEPPQLGSDPRTRGWNIGPRSGALDLPAGGELRVPLEITFSPLQEAGPIDFVLDAEVRATIDYGRVTLRTRAEVGLELLELVVTARPSPDLAGSSVLAEVAVTNRSAEVRELEITVFASPEDERYRSTISGLAPGEQALRRFGYQDARSRLKGSRIFVSVLDLETGARLNRSVRVD